MIDICQLRKEKLQKNEKSLRNQQKEKLLRSEKQQNERNNFSFIKSPPFLEEVTHQEDVREFYFQKQTGIGSARRTNFGNQQNYYLQRLGVNEL